MWILDDCKSAVHIDSRSDAQQWPFRKNDVSGKANIKYKSLVKQENIILSPHHLGIYEKIQNFHTSGVQH